MSACSVWLGSLVGFLEVPRYDLSLCAGDEIALTESCDRHPVRRQNVNISDSPVYKARSAMVWRLPALVLTNLFLSVS
jgi:hypothetical protein